MAYRQIGSSWNSRMREDIDTMFSELYDEYIGAGLDAAEAKEKASQAVADALIAKEDATVAREMVQQIVDGEVGTGALNTEIERKLNELETQYAPDLNDLKTEVGNARGGEISLGDRLSSVDADLAKIALKTLGTVNIKSYETYKNGDDWTPAWDQLNLETPEGYTIEFPTDIYKGNFITNKSYNIDFKNSRITPFLSDRPAMKFEGSIGAQYDVIGNPVYGNTSFQLADVTGLSEGDTGFLADQSTRPSDSKSDINVEMIRIKSVDEAARTVVIYDMVRSDQLTGSVSFNKVSMVKNPKIYNLLMDMPTENQWACVWFLACENPVADIVETLNNTGHALRFDYCYNPQVENIRVIKPSSTGSGQGYGVTFHKCREGRALSLYGNGTRHLFDADSSYDYAIKGIKEVDGKSSAIALSHNGYGGKVSVEDVDVTTDSYAIGWSGQGVQDLDRVVIRDVSIKNIKHIVPNRTPNEYNVTTYLQLDYQNIIVDNQDTHYVNTVDTLTTSSSYGVRLLGNQRGRAEVKNISANQISSLVLTTKRSNLRYINSLVVDNISCPHAMYGARFLGDYHPSVSNISIENVDVAAVSIANNGDSIPVGLNLSNVNVLVGKIIESKGIDLDLKGTYPIFNYTSNASTPVLDGETITSDKLISSGAYLSLLAPVSADATLDGTTPFEPPIWAGQQVRIVINGIGAGVGARGDVVIPGGASTFKNSNNMAQTLESGKLYTLVGNKGVWTLVE